MRRILTERELELLDILKPYSVFPPQNGRGIRSDSPPEIVEAYEELNRIGDAEDERNRQAGLI